MILALDPGPVQTAYLQWNGHEITGVNIASNESVASLIEAYGKFGDRKVIVACEHLQCFGMPVGKEVFETAYWIGEFRATCRLYHRLTFQRVMRSEVKMHLCNSMRATDANIRQALIDRFGDKGTKKAPGVTFGLRKDLWSAFAIAVMVHDKQL